jgi:hypothetical protein
MEDPPMTPEQRIALAAPSLLSFEALHERYHRKVGVWSEVLTINTGYE